VAKSANKIVHAREIPLDAPVAVAVVSVPGPIKAAATMAPGPNLSATQLAQRPDKPTRRVRDWVSQGPQGHVYEGSVSADPACMKAVGHSKWHDDRGDRPCGDVFCIDNLALALVFGLVMDKTHQITIVL